MANSVDHSQLQDLYKSSSSAKAMLDDFANRTNNQRVTKVEQIQNRLRIEGVKRGDVIALFRKLNELNHGRFIEGRKGHPSRFEWTSNPIDVGKASQGETKAISTVPPQSSPSEKPLTQMRDYALPLRSGTDAIFQLPADLTHKEAERLSAFIKTLAVGD